MRTDDHLPPPLQLAALSNNSLSTLTQSTWHDISNSHLEQKPSCEITALQQPTYTWFDHLRAVLCWKPSPGPQVVQNMSFKDSTLGRQNESPYIVEVQVYVEDQNKRMNQMTKVAKCTIDTGNLQGDLVSLDFVENQLDYPASSLLELTESEKVGSITVNGDLHFPIGAMNLSWSHQNGTKFFRNRRFLVSATKDFDLIIGVQSIREDKILNAPMLINGRRDVNLLSSSSSDSDKERQERQERQELENLFHEKNEKVDSLTTQIEEEEDEGRIKDLENKLKLYESDKTHADCIRKMYDIVHSKGSIEEKRKLAKPSWEKIRATPYRSEDIKKRVDHIEERLLTALKYEDGSKPI